MPSAEAQGGPGPDEASVHLRELAEAFFQGAPAAPAQHHSGTPPAAPATVLVDPEGRIQGLDSQAQRLFGADALQMVGSPAEAFLGKVSSGDALGTTVLLKLRDATEVPVWVTTS